MQTTESTKRQRRKPSWPKVVARTLPSGNTSYKIDAIADGKREFHSFKTEAEAINHAWLMFDHRAKQGKAAFELPTAQRVEAVDCFKMLADYPTARLTDAVAYYIERKLKFEQAPNVADGIEKKIVEITDRVGKRTLENHRHRWRKFAEKFGKRQFGEIEAGEISVWLDEITDHPESRHNYRRSVVRLFKLAITNKTAEGKAAPWCRDNPAQECDRVKRSAPAPGIFTPEEIAALFSHADDYKLAPYIILGTFCGLRVSELSRLDWSNVDFTDRTIQITAEITKTKSRRTVDINETAAAWLAPYVKKSGPVVEMVALRERLLQLRKDAGLKHWPTNAMRHSFGSYALRAWQDAGKVAMQMGNSARVCETHYNKTGTKAAAAAFWALRPAADAEKKIVLMQQAVNA